MWFINGCLWGLLTNSTGAIYTAAQLRSRTTSFGNSVSTSDGFPRYNSNVYKTPDGLISKYLQDYLLAHSSQEGSLNPPWMFRCYQNETQRLCMLLPLPFGIASLQYIADTLMALRKVLEIVLNWHLFIFIKFICRPSCFKMKFGNYQILKWMLGSFVSLSNDQKSYWNTAIYRNLIRLESCPI